MTSMTAGDLANCCIVGGHRPPLRETARHHALFVQSPSSARRGMASATIHALMMNRRILNFSRVFLLLLCATATQAQTRITTPNEQFGFNIGDDYVLVNYTQYVDYLKKLSRESDRLKLEEIGKSSEGRTMYLAIVTSSENQKNLARYKEISRLLSAAEGVDEDQARDLAAEGR